MWTQYYALLVVLLPCVPGIDYQVQGVLVTLKQKKSIRSLVRKNSISVVRIIAPDPNTVPCMALLLYHRYQYTWYQVCVVVFFTLYRYSMATKRRHRDTAVYCSRQCNTLSSYWKRQVRYTDYCCSL